MADLTRTVARRFLIRPAVAARYIDDPSSAPPRIRAFLASPAAAAVQAVAATQAAAEAPDASGGIEADAGDAVAAEPADDA